jgi:hypothetical protein
MRRLAKRSSALSPTDGGVEALADKKYAKRKPGRKSGRKGSGARLPGMKGGAVLEDAPKRRTYQSKKPGFPLERAKVIPLCREKHEPLICAGQVLALMDLMEAEQCTMYHLHKMTDVGYATIYDFLGLETFPGTPVLVKLVLALGYELWEFTWIAHLSVKESGDE